MPQQTFLAGKRVHVYDTGSGARTTPEDLRRHLRKFPTLHTLRRLGEAAGKMWNARMPAGIAGKVPLSLHAIPYLALLSIECSNDHRGSPMTDADMEELARLFMDLDDPASANLAHDERAAFEFLLRTGNQFEFQRELRHQLPRIVMLLRDIWPRVEKAKHLVPTDDLVRLTGIDLDRLLLFGWAFSQSGTSGFFRPYTEGQIPGFSHEAQRIFLRWASADYSELRRLGAEAKAKLPNDSFDPYRFNPLAVFPIVRPDMQPDPKLGDVYLLPCQRLLFDRVHRGLYHVLADHHRGAGAGENPFRVAYGYVFQEYVGELLRSALGQTAVLSEIKYRDGCTERDTVDWIVVEGDLGVLVEVKQSALTVPARSLGDLVAARADLKKTVSKAVRQLRQTEAAIRARRPGLEGLSHLREFERVVVTYDSIHFGNSFVRDLVVEELGTETPHAHVCAIEEFEYILGCCPKETLYNVLRRKRFGSDGQDAMDFKDWLAYEDQRDGSQTENPHLSGRYREILRSWGLPAPTAE